MGRVLSLAALVAVAAAPVRAQESPKATLRAEKNQPDAARPAGEAGRRNLPAVTAIDIQKAGAKTQVVLRMSAPIDAVAYLLANPGRAVIDLPEVDFRLDASTRAAPALRRGGFLISGFRVGLLEAGKSRAVFDLSGSVRIASARLETAAGAHRYIVEFEATSRAAFLKAVEASPPAAAAATPAPAAAKPPGEAWPQDARPVIVLDPGHGGIDAGARGVTQAWEKDVVLAFSLTLGEKLRETGRYRVIFTRNEDVFVSLPERVRIARKAGAKLFISIHADSLNERWVEGATVYTVSDRASDIHAARLAEKENQADKLAGVEAGEETDEVSDILFDLARKETRAFSHYFARSLVGYWKSAGTLNKNPLRSAGFRVLMAPDVPSVLLELGYLSSRAEAMKLSQPEWRGKAAAAVARSIETFFLTAGGQGEGLAQEDRSMAGETAAGGRTGVGQPAASAADVASKVR